MRVMKPLNTWLSLVDAVPLDDNMAYLADILQAIPLTLALKALHGDFAVDLQHLGACGIQDDEQSHLQAPSRLGFSREVALCLDGEAVVWARSVCAEGAADWRDTMNCGTMPLGMRLYELPLARTEFEFAYLDPNHPANPSDAIVVARRSCFRLQDAPLLLIESFLPALKSHL